MNNSILNIKNNCSYLMLITFKKLGFNIIKKLLHKQQSILEKI